MFGNGIKGKKDQATVAAPDIIYGIFPDMWNTFSEQSSCSLERKEVTGGRNQNGGGDAACSA